MGFFSSKTKYHEVDPYKYWGPRFGPDYATGVGALRRGIEEARDPESSALYRLGRQALTRHGAIQGERLRSALVGRGTAFGGQGRTAARNVAGVHSRALLELLLKARMQGPQLGAQLTGMTLGAIRAPQVFAEKKMSKAAQWGMGMDLASKGMSLGSQIGTMGMGFMPSGGMGMPAGGGYSASASDLAKYYTPGSMF